MPDHLHLKLDCPLEGCRGRNASFEFTASRISHSPVHSMFGRCSLCLRSIVVDVSNMNPHPPHTMTSSDFYKHCHIIAIHPSPPAKLSIGGLPPEVETIWVEAEHGFESGLQPTMVTMAYRAVMERSLKSLRPAASGSLFHRIESLRDIVPQDLIAMMHEVRFLGNEAAHDAIASRESLADARTLIHLFLIYAFELPMKVSQMRGKRQQALSIPSA